MGMGHQAYSLIEQGRIETIINAKPEERRLFVEEAAGIAKFRERRREALLKMEHTEQNLFRIQDVIGEIRRQIQSLERQVKKAERFKRLRKEIREAELLLAHTEYTRLTEAQTLIDGNLTRLKDDEASLSAQIQERERVIGTSKAQCAEWEERIDSTERTIYEIRATIDREEGRIEASNRELANLSRLDAQYGGEIDELNAKLRAAKKQRTVLQEELGKLGALIIEREKELRARNAQWQALLERSDETAHDLEDQKADLVELLAKQSERKNQITFCERTIHELKSRKERNSQEIKESTEDLQKTRSSLLEREAARESLKKKQQKCNEEAKALEGKIISLEEKLSQKESDMRAIDHQHQMALSKLRSLEELHESFEGFDEGVKTVMRFKGSKLGGIRGLVADILETEPPYEVAVSAALDHRLQYLIVQSHKDGIEAIDLLRKQGSGRIGLIPMDLRGQETQSSPSFESQGGIIGPLLKHVRLKSEYRHLGHLLLGNTWLVESLDKAIRVWQNGGSFHCLVTLEGEVIDTSGIIMGGSRNGQAFQILRRKNRIKSLTAEVAKNQSKLNNIRTGLEETRESLADVRVRIDSKQREKQALTLDQVAMERDIEQFARKIEDHERRQKVLVFEQEQLESEIARSERESLEARREMEDLESSLKTKRAAIETARHKLEESQSQKDLMDKEMTQVKVKIAEWQEKRKGAQRNLDALEEQERDVRGQISKRLEMLEETRKTIQKTEQDIVEVTGRVQEYKKKQEEVKEQLAQEKRGLKEKSKTLRNLEDLSGQDHLRMEDLKKRIHERNLQLAETHLNLNHVVEGIRERYRIDLRVSPILEEIQTREVLNQTELTRLKASLDSLGEVNLVALQEYEDLKERADFLVGQQDDLKASLSRLKKAIQRIDRTTRRRFRKAFEGTNEKFQILFPRLFDGGKAALVMTDEEDILNTGIEILVQLPGKRLRRLDLLSGGEKALVAIALIFSFFLYRPTPFCLLDEVDAPLDDANVAKFLDMIRELSDQSQLILITHNKKTMEVANTLYGITMESPGISKVVSVKLSEPESSESETPENQINLAANS